MNGPKFTIKLQPVGIKSLNKRTNISFFHLIPKRDLFDVELITAFNYSKVTQLFNFIYSFGIWVSKL